MPFDLDACSVLDRVEPQSAVIVGQMPGSPDSNIDLAWLTWLTERDGGGGGATGFDAIGWESDTWVLHHMYEVPDADPELTHDEVHHEGLESGGVAPSIIGSVNLDEVSVVVGGSLGMSAPEPGWRRLRWSELAERLSVSLDGHETPPNYRWFPYRSWPSSLQPPNEGSLNSQGLETLVDLLAAFSSGGRSTRCVAYYSPLANGARFEEDFVREVALGEIGSVVDRERGRVGTPSNWWPLDRSWMVFTDWDLWGTKVSGPLELVDELRSSRSIECIDWHPSSDQN